MILRGIRFQKDMLPVLAATEQVLFRLQKKKNYTVGTKTERIDNVPIVVDKPWVEGRSDILRLIRTPDMDVFTLLLA